MTRREEAWLFEILDPERFEESLSRTDPLPTVDVQTPAKGVPCRRLFARLSLSTRAKLRAHTLDTPVLREDPLPHAAGRWITRPVDRYDRPDPRRRSIGTGMDDPSGYAPIPRSTDGLWIVSDPLRPESEVEGDDGMYEPDYDDLDRDETSDTDGPQVPSP